jgi:hypothetical protein
VSPPRVSRRWLAWYLAVVMGLGLAVGAASWFVLGWLGVDGDERLLIATQTPVVMVVLLWAVAIAARPEGER